MDFDFAIAQRSSIFTSHRDQGMPRKCNHAYSLLSKFPVHTTALHLQASLQLQGRACGAVLQDGSRAARAATLRHQRGKCKMQLGEWYQRGNAASLRIDLKC